MNLFIRIGRAFYGIGIIAYGVQQFLIKDFRSVILPEFPSWPHKFLIFPYVTGLALIFIGILICGVLKIREINLRIICLYLGLYFLIIILFCHLPTQLIISPNSPRHLGVWTDALKELAICGGAFVVASSYDEVRVANRNSLSYLLEKLIPVGPVFFSITMISFGIDHFYYTEFVAGLVPRWLGMPEFWTYFAGVALIGSGLAIALNIFRKQVAFLLAVMIFLWIFLVHIPDALANPYEAHGNKIVSAFDALLFSGVALIIASLSRRPGSSSFRSSSGSKT